MEIRRLNTIRGLAALIVVVSHFSNVSGLWGKVLGLGSGQLGVMLFFLLSGFLMSHLYWEKQPTSTSLRLYAVSRAARVLPLYLAIVLLSFATPYLYNIHTTRELISHLLFLHGNVVLWTIPPEIQFYLLFGLAWSLLWRRKLLLLPLLCCLIVASFLFTDLSVTKKFFGFPVTAAIIKSLPYFILGSVFGGLYRHRDYVARYQSHWFVLVLGFILLLYPMIFSAAFGFKYAIWRGVGTWSAMGTIFFCLVFLVPDRNPLLENRIGDFFGKVSYSLYLLHLPVLHVLAGLGWVEPGVFSLLLFIALASLTAWISFTLFEAPTRKAIRALFTAQRSSDRVQPTASAERT